MFEPKSRASRIGGKHFSTSESTCLKCQKWRRSDWLAPGNDDPNCGFTLFIDDARSWLHDLGALGEENPAEFNDEGEYDPLPF